MTNRLPKEFVASASQALPPGSRITQPLLEDQRSFGTKMLDAAAECVGSRPLLSLGFIFAFGIVLGKLVKR
jgi:hypothetical protein